MYNLVVESVEASLNSSFDNFRGRGGKSRIDKRSFVCTVQFAGDIVN